MGQLVETATAPSTVEQAPVNDPSICPEDFFHAFQGPDEEVEKLASGSSKTLGIYAVTPANCGMTDFLRRVAISRSVTGHNIESWVTAVEEKLCDIGITTP
jgi:hypothetical protein